MSSLALAQTPPQSDPRFTELGERLDRLMTVEMRPMSGGLPVGIVVPVYEICRARSSGPLSTTVASALIHAVGPGDTVLIVTGAGVEPELPQGETDGPLGAAALARAMLLGLRARPVLVTEPAHAAPLEACLAIAGPPGQDIATLAVSSGPAEIDDALGELLVREQPRCVVFIERDGANAEGRYHGIRGNTRADCSVVALDLLADLAHTASITTIGIGGGGNEVGFGDVRDSIAPLLPHKGACWDGCPSGLLTTRRTDLALSASVSNWGAYAVCAALAAVLDKPETAWTGALELAALRAAVAAGARDGATSRAEPTVDGIAAEVHIGVVDAMRAIAAASR